MNVLVTGGAGFIGSNLVDACSTPATTSASSRTSRGSLEARRASSRGASGSSVRT
jgi:nucleoside-diphosphate-sugar epimerase